MTDFNQFIDLTKDIETTLFGKVLILKDLYIYTGPLTMQYLPYGGIQSVYNGQIIIHTKSGYIASKNVIYDGIKMSSSDFTYQFDHLVNEVLPN